jgi:hypothetical protein
MIPIGPFVNQIWWWVSGYMQASMRMVATFAPALLAAAIKKQENMSSQLRISARVHRSHPFGFGFLCFFAGRVDINFFFVPLGSP